ncbi:MAG: mandelate racemase/muconate lactonizing enzyme family protein [Planctomycetaceae bacterium]
MRIEAIECELYFIPLPQVLSDSTHGEMSHFSLITVKVLSSDGSEGLGYTYTVGRTGGPSVLAMLSHDLAPVIQGEDPRQIEALWEKMWWAVHYVGRGGIASFAISAVDIAVWDLKAKQSGQPLWQLLGGQDHRVRAYAGGIDLQLPLDALRVQTQDNLDRGFRAIKMKVGRDRLDEDIERVAMMRKLVGADVPLMVDANMRWSVEQAIRAARAFAEHNVYWLEEPTLPEDFSGHRRIVQEGGVPVASGENLRSVDEFQKLIAAGGVNYPEPDVSNVGGITAWMQVARLAAANNLPVTSHGVHDLHVHLLAAVPNASFLEVHGFGLERFLRQPLTIHDGAMLAPLLAGHGVEFDWDALATHRA